MMHVRFEEVQQRIMRACEAAGRSPEQVRLVAVSKGHSVDKIIEAYELGQRDFGENYALEMAEKIEALKARAPDIRWHYMGRIQSNKMRSIAQAHWIHSLYEVRHAVELSGFGQKIKVLLQVNLGGEENRNGVSEDLAIERYDEIRALPHLNLCGLMTIAPLRPLVSPTRWFSKMADLKKKIQDKLAVDVPELSMGMSEDFEDAIACSATIVRIGTLLFGDRHPR